MLGPIPPSHLPVAETGTEVTGMGRRMNLVSSCIVLTPIESTHSLLLRTNDSSRYLVDPSQNQLAFVASQSDSCRDPAVITAKKRRTK